ncbi:AI-2E family transporter [Candidatus Kaiserbacteria bacterium]|nr:MAG: AI-2E family transporter [Candidatus Kaiserbacteria bacterium]
MSITPQKLVEHIFFFGILGASAYLVWGLFVPFVGALSLAAIVVTVCYPIHERIILKTPRRNQTLAAFISLAFVLTVVVLPLGILASLILHEAVSVYSLIGTSDNISFFNSIASIEQVVQKVIPNFTLNIAMMIQQAATFIVNHFVTIFTTTAATVFQFFISLIAAFYFFRDGRYFTTYLIKLSPLRDSYDEQIIARLARAIRAVALGTVLVAMVQGTLTAVGLTLFGFDRAILWGCVAAIGALVPGVGTAIVFIPAVAYLLIMGAQLPALLLTIWGLLAVGLIDNLLGPYVMGRGNKMHPFLILIAVLGGIVFFGPLGFILGPVILSLFLVLLEIYHSHIKTSQQGT